jgi:hypothetical protein
MPSRLHHLISELHELVDYGSRFVRRGEVDKNEMYAVDGHDCGVTV